MLSFHQSILRREGLEPSRPSSFPDSPKWSVHTCILRLAGGLVVAEPDGLPAVRYLEILEIERGVAGRGAKPGERNHQWPERAAVRARRGLRCISACQLANCSTTYPRRIEDTPVEPHYTE